MSTIKFKLGETEYEIPPLKLGQIKRIMLAPETGAERVFAVMKIIVERVEPKIEDIEEVEATAKQLHDIVQRVLKASGMIDEKTVDRADLPNSQPPGAADEKAPEQNLYPA
jgi:hypothetical protein